MGPCYNIHHCVTICSGWGTENRAAVKANQRINNSDRQCYLSYNNAIITSVIASIPLATWFWRNSYIYVYLLYWLIGKHSKQCLWFCGFSTSWIDMFHVLRTLNRSVGMVHWSVTVVPRARDQYSAGVSRAWPVTLPIEINLDLPRPLTRLGLVTHIYRW